MELTSAEVSGTKADFPENLTRYVTFSLIGKFYFTKDFLKIIRVIEKVTLSEFVSR